MNGYMTTHDDREREGRARASATCPVCGWPKTIGAVVCWDWGCWRGPDGLKNSPEPVGVWLARRGNHCGEIL